MKQNKIRYYCSFTDDFNKSENQDFDLPEDYKWIRKDIFSMALSGICYFAAVVFGFFYCKFILHIKIYGRKKTRGFDGKFFVFGNHTQPIGDVVIPALAVLPKRIYTVVSPANYGIPFIGKTLPYLGALPTSKTLGGMKGLSGAIKYRLEHGHPIVIYPEAHVWHYYTGIRPFGDTPFKFPVRHNCPCFSMTATYKRSKIFRRPLTRVYIDGPFFPEGQTPKQKAANLKDKIYDSLTARAYSSDYEYIEYKEKTP